MKPCVVPLPLEYSHPPRRWPRVSGRVLSRALWFFAGFFSALSLAGFIAGLIP